MDKSSSIIDLSASLRSTGFEPMQAAATLSLMLLWSQFPSGKLKGLPELRDTSAEFVLKASIRVEKILCPEVADQISDIWTGRRPGDVEILRRAIMNALDSNVPVDDIAETILEYCAPDLWITKKHCSALLAVLNAKRRTRIRCEFRYCLRPAWTLSKRNFVALDIENHEYAPILTILSKACGRSLSVRVGTIGSVANPEAPRSDFDHALIIPPIGLHRKFGPPSTLHFEGMNGAELSAELFATLWGAHLGRKRNVVIVGNGLLFRRSSTDAAFKRDLIRRQGLEAIVSLPRGLLPGTAMAMSALVFSGHAGPKRRTETIRFIDAGDPAALSPVSLGKALAGKLSHPLSVDSSFRDVSDGGFNLLVGRYVWDAATKIHREALNSHETVTLSDLADIQRPQALPRGSGKEKGFEVREALLADIGDGRLSLPAKLSELPQSAATSIATAILKPGDILLSIKGTIGRGALINADIVAESDPAPIVPGQSFVIIRLRMGVAIRYPEVLFSYLRSPVAQALLQGMAGGTTIANVAMKDLKSMPVPALPMEQQRSILTKYNERQHIQREIDKLTEKMKDAEAQIFDITLHSGLVSHPSLVSPDSIGGEADSTGRKNRGLDTTE